MYDTGFVLIVKRHRGVTALQRNGRERRTGSSWQLAKSHADLEN